MVIQDQPAHPRLGHGLISTTPCSVATAGGLFQKQELIYPPSAIFTSAQSVFRGLKTGIPDLYSKSDGSLGLCL